MGEKVTGFRMKGRVDSAPMNTRKIEPILDEVKTGRSSLPQLTMKYKIPADFPVGDYILIDIVGSHTGSTY